MAKQVQVRYTGKHFSVSGALVAQDLTVGCIYDAELPAAGELDKDGLEVAYPDELWISADDVGYELVTQLSDGFELVV
jgi:hypothetical protein